jgi:hypothetical protein
MSFNFCGEPNTVNRFDISVELLGMRHDFFGAICMLCADTNLYYDNGKDLSNKSD